MLEFYGDYQVYSESGIDLTLLRENLRRSLEERWEHNRRAAILARAFGEAGRRHRGLPALSDEEVCAFDPAAVLRRLTDWGVEYVLVDGLAMTVHGCAHVAEALEVCCRQTAENIAALGEVFVPLHPQPRGTPSALPFGFDATTLVDRPPLSLTTDMGEVELLSEVAGVGHYDEVSAQSEEHALFGVTVRVLSLGALVASKKAAGRLKDRNHLLELEELKKLKDTTPEG
jgi:hypothetical protein